MPTRSQYSRVNGIEQRIALEYEVWKKKLEEEQSRGYQLPNNLDRSFKSNVTPRGPRTDNRLQELQYFTNRSAQMTPQMSHADVNQGMAGNAKPAVRVLEEIKQSNQNHQTLYHDMSPYNGSIP